MESEYIHGVKNVTIKHNIDEVIAFLVDRMNEGYTTVELIDDGRSHGWFRLDEGIDFTFSKNYPHVVGIDARSFKEEEK